MKRRRAPRRRDLVVLALLAGLTPPTTAIGKGIVSVAPPAVGPGATIVVESAGSGTTHAKTISREASMYMLARAVRMVTAIVVAFIVAGILVHVLGANTSNGIVSVIDDVAKWLVQPFDNLFKPSGEKARIALNWGIAAVVYAIVGGLLARTLARSALAGQVRRPWRRRPVV